MTVANVVSDAELKTARHWTTTTIGTRNL